jgi:hypothetical protein
MTRTEKVSLICALLGTFVAGYGVRAYAEGGPQQKPLFYAGTLSVEGRLVTGPHAVELALYDALAGGSALCLSQTPVAEVTNGHFRVELSDACVTTLRAKPDTFMQVTFTGEDDVVHTMTRVKVGSVPYALEADHAVSASRAASASKADSASAGDATVSGVLHVGARVVSDCEVAGGGYTDCACADGELAISGGAYAAIGDFITESRHVAASGGEPSAWRVACAHANGARAACASPHAICVRLGP